MTGSKIISIDQGTTGSTVVLIDFTDSANPVVVTQHTTDFPQHFPKTGWVEHDLEEIWQSVSAGVAKVLSDSQIVESVKEISAIGITNQRETLCVFEKGTGKPLCPAIVWQCKRSAEICVELKNRGLEGLFQQKTGLVLDPYFTGTKLTWLMRHNKAVADALKSEKALVGTIDSWLLYRLTGCTVHATEASNASRTLLFNIHTGKWDQELLDILEVPHHVLPEVKDSAGFFGKTLNCGILDDGIAIAGILGDQQSALVGQACFKEGEAKCTYGTGAFMLANIGEIPGLSQNGLLTTVAWGYKGSLVYAFEGSAFIAGAAVQFIRDQLNFVKNAADTLEESRDVKASPEVYFVPALSGLGAPWWNPRAQGAFLGLTRGTSKSQLIRATLEGIAFQVADLSQAMSRDLGSELSALKVDGGASANDLLMQFQADILNIAVDRPRNLETTAFGAALFSCLGIGIYKNFQDLVAARHSSKVFESGMGKHERESHLKGWRKAVRAVTVFSEEN